MATTTPPETTPGSHGPAPLQPPRPDRQGPWLLELYGSALGKKYVMAVTGMIGMVYLVGHMAGNLKIYLGQEDIDHYGEWLRTIGYPALPHGGFLWIFRAVLVVALVLHVHAAWSLTQMNKRADRKYVSRRDLVAANFASRSMRWTGIIVLAFIVFHLMDLTWGTVNPGFVRGSVYRNLLATFDRVPVTIFYVVANLALGVHLWHGAWSLFQSIGWNNPRFNKWRTWFAWAFTAVVVGGNVSFPLAIAFGIVE